MPGQTASSSLIPASGELYGPSLPIAAVEDEAIVTREPWPEPDPKALPSLEAKPLPAMSTPTSRPRGAQMSLTVIGPAPLKIPRKIEVVASAQKWHLAINHFAPDNRSQPKYYLFDRRKCLDLILDIKRAWWRIAFHRAMRKASPGTRLEGIYTSSELLELKRDLFGDYIAVFGIKLRRKRGVQAFRRGMLATMKLGRYFSAELVKNQSRLA